MTKKELSRVVAEAQGLTYKQSEAIIAEVFNTISSRVSNGETVKIAKFGAFRSTLKEGKIPGTSKSYKTILPKFRASTVFKDEVNS